MGTPKVIARMNSLLVGKKGQPLMVAFSTPSKVTFFHVRYDERINAEGKHMDYCSLTIPN